MKKYLHLTLLLCFITALSGFILAGVNEFTKDKIAEIKQENIDKGITELFTDAKSNKVILSDDTASIMEVRDIYSDANQTDLIGYTFIIKAPGSYSTQLEVMVGVDKNGNAIGIEYLNNPETPGVGAKVATLSWFNQQFIGLQYIEGQWLKNSQPATVDKVSGATYTSTSVIKSVKLALEYYDQNLKN